MKKKYLIFILLVIFVFVIGACGKQTNLASLEETDMDTEIFVLPTPTFEYYASEKVVHNNTMPLNLNMKLNEPNEITDIGEWFSKNELSLSPFETLTEFNPGISFSDGIYTFQLDNSSTRYFNIYDTSKNELMYKIDYSEFIYAPEYIEEDYAYVKQLIKWATIKDNILYIQNDHGTYAESSNNKNAYITAIDLSDMSILWRTDALVCNSRNFVIYKDIIICGYGFTSETDSLFQIDINTGKVISEIPLNSMAEYIVLKDKTIYVRCYDTNYEFEIQ